MKYGLIGEHLPHSYSKEIHERIANYTYHLWELSPESVASFMEKRNFAAINVTIPYKETVIPYLAKIDDGARLIGAVNTVVNRGGTLYGYNTDFFGMEQLFRRVGADVNGRKVLILGTGGTAKTARAVAEHLGAASIVTAGRRKKDGVITYKEALALHRDADYLVNTTPCGMYPHQDGAEGFPAAAVDIACFPCLRGVIDAVYNPLRTNLILDAKKRGIPAEGGLYMLVAQAVKASAIFLGKESKDEITDRVYEEIRREKENIVLTGMPACGKSTVGKLLAKHLDRPFFDSDTEIVQEAGMPIPEIFEKYGEKEFRNIETRVILRLGAQCRGCVIATGGGAILRDENVRALERNSRIYFINRDVECLVPTKDRPLTSDAEAIRRRFAERYERYLSTCHQEIRSDEVIEHTETAIRKDFFS